jgi:CRISPR system Cascade subunit CasA
MNLIISPWLPFTAADGAHAPETPAGVLDPSRSSPALALDFPRPDWNAAVLELLIGLVAVAFAPKDHMAWRERWARPPSRAELDERLGRLAFAFNLDGDGPRAFQDLDPLDDAETKEVGQLLIDAPGKNTVKNNSDLFVKRYRSPPRDLAHVAAALVTLQTYAPEGGAGHFTSLRGGGPLTTLVHPSEGGATAPTVWHRVWANMPIARDPVPTGDASDPAWASLFSWIAPSRGNRTKNVVGPDEGHCLHAFFGTPRRIRLVIEADEAGALVARSYRTRTYGRKYEGWIHPLSPYREKDGGLLSLRPRAGHATYREWVGVWSGGAPEGAAEVVRRWRTQRARDADARTFEVNASGYAMDSAKALQWTESRVPDFAFDSLERADVFFEIAKLLAIGAVSAASALTGAAKFAAFGSVKDEKSLAYYATNLAERFWRETEWPFRELLDRLFREDDPDAIAREVAFEWRATLKSAVLRLFDDAVGDAGDHAQDMKRLVHARGRLAAHFADKGTAKSASVTAALNLPLERSKARKEEAAA